MHRRFRIGDGESQSGPRLGGLAPALERSLPLSSGSEYVLTFPLFEMPPLFVSVFVNGGVDVLWDAMNSGVQSDDRIVAIRHNEIPRGRSKQFASELSAHPLEISPRTDHDLVDDGTGGTIVYSAHKFGGRPYCIQEPELEGTELLLKQGFVHALQLGFPGRSDGDVSGNWPFADGLFNLFLKPDDPTVTYWAFQK
jgi:hypothetical protein